MYRRHFDQAASHDTKTGIGFGQVPTHFRLTHSALAIGLMLAVSMHVGAASPVSTEDSSFFPAGATEDFGTSVAAYGDTAVIGDPLNDLDGNSAGAAWVYVRSGSTWTEYQRLIPSGISDGDAFGYSVDIYDDYIVVGAPWDLGAGGVKSGSAYVFRRLGGTWIEDAKLVGAATSVSDPYDTPGYGDKFGNSVAINGDIPADATNKEIWHNIFVGSPRDTHSGWIGAGSVHGFQLSGDATAWIGMGKTHLASPTYGDEFGGSVDLDGDHMIIGCHLGGDDLIGSSTDAGVAYVFVRRGMLGTWAMETRLNASDYDAYDNFGTTVAVNAIGGVATFVVGSPNDDDLGYDSGSAYVFRGSALTFPQLMKLTASDGDTGDSFGSSVAATNDLMLVGAVYGGGPASGGSVYVVSRRGWSWEESRVLQSSTAYGGDLLGSSVALAGDTALAGAPMSNGSAYYSGTVFVLDDLYDEEIFSDDFESGDTTAWSQVVP